LTLQYGYPSLFLGRPRADFWRDLLTTDCNHFASKRQRRTLRQSSCSAIWSFIQAQTCCPSKKAAPPPVPVPPPAQDQDQDSSEYESSSEDENPGHNPQNAQDLEESETPEHQDIKDTPDQEHLHQEGAPKPDPNKDSDSDRPDQPGPAPPASPNPLPSRNPSPDPTPLPPPEPLQSPSPQQAAMSVIPECTSCSKWPAPCFYTGEGKDRDPLRINSWFNTVHGYISSFVIPDTDPEAFQYYGVYCREKVLEKFTQSDNSEGAKTFNRLKRIFEGYFLPSTSTDTIYE